MVAFTSHYGHFIEEVMSGLALQAAAGLDSFVTGACCRCKENFAGERSPLNRWVMKAVWGADWRHCNEYAAPGAWGTRLAPPDAPPGSALRVATGCMVDRYVAHKDWRTDAINHCNANIAGAASTPAMQRRVEEQIARFRASPLIVEANLTGFVDEHGVPIEATVRAAGGPLVVILYRKVTAHRAITAESMAALADYVRSAHTPRVLSVRFELLPEVAQLALAAAADVMLGMQGNGLSHLLWMRRGGAVLEFFPHYKAGADGEGTGWTNDWPMLTRLRGMVYRAADVAWGAANPVAHPIRDDEHSLNVYNNVIDMARAKPVIDDLFAAWRAAREAASKAGGVDKIDMREYWHPEVWRPAAGEEPFYAEAGWHPNHARRRREAGGAPVGGE
jgi:hypothetical protein